MATTFRIKPSNLARLQRVYAQAPGRLYGGIERSLRQSANEWHRAMDKRTKGATRPDGLARRTGDLARSIQTKTTGAPPNLSSLKMRAVSAGVPYAPIHEFGGVVRPKRAKFLTVPASDNLTAAGVVRIPSARRLFASRSGKGRRPFVLRKGAKAWIVLPKANGKDLLFLWSLHKSVKIPARLGFFDTWEKYAPARRRRFRRALASALRSSPGA